MTILRIDSVRYYRGVTFNCNKFGGVRLEDVLVSKWHANEDSLPDGFRVAEYDGDFKLLGARIPPYWVGPDGTPRRGLIE